MKLDKLTFHTRSGRSFASHCHMQERIKVELFCQFKVLFQNLFLLRDNLRSILLQQLAQDVLTIGEWRHFCCAFNRLDWGGRRMLSPWISGKCPGSEAGQMNFPACIDSRNAAKIRRCHVISRSSTDPGNCESLFSSSSMRNVQYVGLQHHFQIFIHPVDQKQNFNA